MVRYVSRMLVGVLCLRGVANMVGAVLMAKHVWRQPMVVPHLRFVKQRGGAVFPEALAP